jgi:PhnB protein
MKVMVIVKASASSEAGKLPSEELLAAMGSFNEALVEAGIMESGDGLRPSSEGFRVRFCGADRTVTKGPFVETNELLAGYWVWNVQSMDEAIEWVKKCPNPMEEESDIEIRPFYEMDDFAEIDATGECRERENALRNAIAMQKSTIHCYLFFSGCCEEALNFYQEHLSAKVKMLMRFNESPDPVPENMLQEGFENKIMHAEFSVGNNRILASDGCDDKSTFAGFRLALTVQEKAEATRIFSALAQGGTVDMPLGETFWSPLFGMLTDQYGVGWMIMLAGEQPE